MKKLLIVLIILSILLYGCVELSIDPYAVKEDQGGVKGFLGNIKSGFLKLKPVKPTKTFCPVCLDKPDLVVTDIEITPCNPEEGESMMRVSQIKNQGGLASPVVNIKCYVDGVQTCYGSFGPVQPGATQADYSHNVHWGGPWTAIPGTHKFEWVIDADNHASECDETNNKFTRYVEVPAKIRPVTNCQELQNMKNNLAGSYYLANDINCSDTRNWNNGTGFEPVGSLNSKFTGSFDGKGYKITELHINRPNTSRIGLFGTTYSSSEIKNVSLEGITIIGKNYVGGLAGSNAGSISSSYTKGNVTGIEGPGTGGLVGSHGYGSISNSYSMASVNGHMAVGGLVGHAILGSITKTYSTGRVNGGFGPGGLVGQKEINSSCQDSYWDVQTSGQNTSACGIGKTTAEMMRKATFTGWDFTNTWDICENKTYPWLKWQNITCAQPPKVSGIPDQTIYIPDETVIECEDFTPFDLDDYVEDPDHLDSELTWTVTGNTRLNVEINAEHIVTITYTCGWTGSETLTFTARDPDGQTSSDEAKFTVKKCGEFIDNEHVRFGFPNTDRVLFKPCYVIGHADNYKTPNWTAYHLTKEYSEQDNVERCNDFGPDTEVPPEFRPNKGNYSGSGYDQGHMVPADDTRRSAECMGPSCKYSNICPQIPYFNENGLWIGSENLVRSWAEKTIGSIWIFAGPMCNDTSFPKGCNTTKGNPDDVVVPNFFYKIVVSEPEPCKFDAIAFLFPHDDTKINRSRIPEFITSIDHIENETGLDFLNLMDDELEAEVEAKTAPGLWPTG